MKRRKTYMCRKCEGCGCPACLGIGTNVTATVAAWGKLNGHPGLRVEDVPNLPVKTQREVKRFVLNSL